jgi:hypothetical protein
MKRLFPIDFMLILFFENLTVLCVVERWEKKIEPRTLSYRCDRHQLISKIKTLFNFIYFAMIYFDQIDLVFCLTTIFTRLFFENFRFDLLFVLTTRKKRSFPIANSAEPTLYNKYKCLKIFIIVRVTTTMSTSIG